MRAGVMTGWAGGDVVFTICIRWPGNRYVLIAVEGAILERQNNGKGFLT